MFKQIKQTKAWIMPCHCIWKGSSARICPCLFQFSATVLQYLTIFVRLLGLKDVKDLLYTVIAKKVTDIWKARRASTKSQKDYGSFNYLHYICWSHK